jgi:hypothetical protein
MKRAVLYLRVSTVDQTTANQERELRAVAERAGWEVVHVYKDHGISGAKGRDKRPQYNAMLRDAFRRQFDVVMAWSVDRLGRSLQELVTFLGRAPRAPHRSASASAGDRHHNTRRQGAISDDGRVCRVRTQHDPGASPCRACAGQERGETLGTTNHPAGEGRRHRAALSQPGRPGVRVIAKQFGVDPSTVQRISRPFGEAASVAV